MKKLLLVLFPLFVLCVARFALGFDGLYGQDAYEYLRYTGRLHAFFSGGAHPGDYFWPLGYPFYGALLGFVVNDLSFALQLVSALGLAGTALYAARMLELLFPGKKGVYLYVFLFLLCSPFLLRSGVLCMSDSACVFFSTAFFYYTFRFRREEKGAHLAVLFFLAGNAIMFRYASAVLLVLPSVFLLKNVLKRKHLLFIGAGLLLFVLAIMPHILLRREHAGDFLGHEWLSGWSVMNYFRSDFTTADGTQQHALPNILYALGGVFHPGNFAFGAIALVALFRRGGWKVEEKLLLGSVLVYLFFLAGIPSQNMRFFLPALPLAVAGMFGGFVFLYEKLSDRWIAGLASVAIAGQLVMFSYGFRILYERNRLEKTIAAWFVMNTSHKTIYSFDIDVALKARISGRDFRNLWVEEYDTFEPGSLVLFNPSTFSKQWDGMNPMKNWEKMNLRNELRPLQQFAQGWQLYEIR